MQNKNNIAESGLVFLLKEMNNPLTNIRLSVELLENGNEEMRQVYYDIIKKNTALLEAAVKELSDTFLQDEGFGMYLKPNVNYSLPDMDQDA